MSVRSVRGVQQLMAKCRSARAQHLAHFLHTDSQHIQLLRQAVHY